LLEWPSPLKSVNSSQWE